MTELAALPRLRFGLILWAAGSLGVVAYTALVLPQMLGQGTLPASLWVLSLASFAQSSILLALAVWIGVALAPAVGLRAPAFEALVMGRPVAPVLRSHLLPGFIAGMLGAMLLYAVGRYAPTALAEAQERIAVPLVARVLYGGITEEILVRWGLMTSLVWLAWRFLQRRRGAVRAGFVWLAIAVSAFIFGTGHLPVVSALVGVMDADVVAFVIGGNMAFGLLFGYLFWRYGLESAMIAHALTHVVSCLANLA